jgi:hypothetical protein
MQTLILVSLCFLISMLVTHLPMIRVKRYQKGVIHDRDRWAVRLEQSDYLYLVLALVAIVPAANDIDRLALRSELDERLLAGSPDSSALRSNLLEKDLQERRPDLWDFLYHHDQVLAEAERFHGQAQSLLKIRRFRESQGYLRTAIELYRPVWGGLVPFGEPPVEVPPEPTLSELVNSKPNEQLSLLRCVYGNLKDSCALLDVARKLDSYEYTMSLVQFGPYLLAIGFAIRFAKTSGKLLLEAQKRLPRGPAHPCQ